MYKSLVKFKNDWKIIWAMVLLGLSAFIRVMGLAIMVIVYNIFLEMSNSVVFQQYQDVNLPILTLFFTTLFGIWDGGRPLLVYNYTLNDIKRCKQVYWWTMMLSLGYGLIAFVFVATIANPFLTLFDFPYNSTSLTMNNANAANYLRIIMLRTFLFSVAIPGMMLYQGLNNIKMSIITSAVEGVFVYYILFGIFYGTGVSVASSPILEGWIMTSSFMFSALISGFIIAGLAQYTLHKNLYTKVSKFLNLGL